MTKHGIQKRVKELEKHYGFPSCELFSRFDELPPEPQVVEWAILIGADFLLTRLPAVKAPSVTLTSVFDELDDHTLKALELALASALDYNGAGGYPIMIPVPDREMLKLWHEWGQQLAGRRKARAKAKSQTD